MKENEIRNMLSDAIEGKLNERAVVKELLKENSKSEVLKVLYEIPYAYLDKRRNASNKESFESKRRPQRYLNLVSIIKDYETRN